MEPLISCLCLTMGPRGSFLTKAIEAYHKQTWPNRELLIVADPDYDYRSNVRTKEKLTVGMKRNIGCKAALGEYIAVWDDDDYYAPRRLEEQYKALEASGKAVCTIRKAPFRQGDDWYVWEPGVQDSGTGIGSSLFFKKSWWQDVYKFPHTSLGEDAGFKHEALRTGQLHVMENPTLMYVGRHAGNTWRQPLPAPGFQRLVGFTWEDGSSSVQ